MHTHLKIVQYQMRFDIDVTLNSLAFSLSIVILSKCSKNMLYKVLLQYIYIYIKIHFYMYFHVSFTYIILITSYTLYIQTWLCN